MTKLSVYIVHFALLLFPSAVLTLNAAKDLAIGLLLLNAVIMLAVTWREWPNLSREIKLVLLAFGLFALWATYSTFVTGQLDAEGHKRWERYSSFAFAPLLVLLFYKIGGIREDVLVSAFALGCGTVFAYAVYQYNVPTPEFGRRAWGDTHPNRYGGASMAMAVVCLSYALLSSYRAPVKILLLICAGLGVCAALYSGTRGSWLAFPAVLCVLVLLYIKKKQQWRKALAWGVGTFICVAAVASTFNIDKQIQRTYSSIAAYQEGNTQTSIGLRFEMFRAAMLLNKQSPLVGVGVGNYHAAAKDLVDNSPEHQLNPNIKQFHNPHNEYLLSLAERGLIGLLAFLLVLAVPIYAFYKQYIANYSTSAAAGIAVVVCFSVVGLSIGLFEHSAFAQLYLFTITILLCVKKVGASALNDLNEIDQEKH